MNREQRNAIWGKEPFEVPDDDLAAFLEDRYTAEEIPPCCVCGGPLSIQRAGGGERTVWACSGYEDDPDNPGHVRRQPGRGVADEHYSKSRWEQMKSGDQWVLELVRRFKLR